MDDQEVIQELENRIHRLEEDTEKLEGAKARTEIQIAANKLGINCYSNLITECQTHGLSPFRVVGG